jgi:hypothetical protein
MWTEFKPAPEKRELFQQRDHIIFITHWLAGRHGTTQRHADHRFQHQTIERNVFGAAPDAAGESLIPLRRGGPAEAFDDGI